MSTKIQKGNSILRPRARLIKTIGEELISNDIVAIIELVKNSYDADANIIEITFDGRVIIDKEDKKRKKILLKENSSITIHDDGTGMPLDIIKTAWMEPATIIKKLGKRSVGKRRFTGEKGIGRFASAKLSSNLEIITKIKNDNEVVSKFNWSDFSDDDKYLDQVKCSWEVRTPHLIKKHGTTLILKNLNTDWAEEKIHDLRVALSRLINPVAPIPDFLIELYLPDDLKEYSGLIESPESLNRPDYLIKGKVDSDGRATMQYKSKKGAKYSLKDYDLKLRPKRIPVSGPFTFEFRVWNRDPESLKSFAREVNSSVKNIKRDLDDLCGISIYRDQFRVLPYGESYDDWLRLDLRRVNNPTLRISNNQIIGYVSLSLDENPDLKDQSNRQGLVEKQALTDLKEMIISILNELEQKRYDERPREDDNHKEENIFEKFSIAPVAELVKEKLSGDKKAQAIVEATEKNIEEGIKKVQEVLGRYRRLSTLGLLIDVVLHDGNSFLLRMEGDILILDKELKKEDFDKEKIQKHLSSLREERKILSQMFKRLEPFGGRKRGRPKDIILEQQIQNVFALFKTELEKHKIIVTLPQGETTVRIDEGELQIMLVNLLQNSIYWLEDNSDERKIEIGIESSDGQISILFSDNGPGIKEENYQKIFEPYFTTKKDGIGLGLTIIGELITEYDGEFTLVKDGPLDGTTFKLTFRRRI